MGNLKPSEADRQLTNKLSQAGKLLDISVLDHLVPFHHPRQRYRRPPMVQGYTSGKCCLFDIGFPGLAPLSGYALFGAYAVKWIGFIKSSRHFALRDY
jgi:hypothetical protein